MWTKNEDKTRFSRFLFFFLPSTFIFFYDSYKCEKFYEKLASFVLLRTQNIIIIVMVIIICVIIRSYRNFFGQNTRMLGYAFFYFF